MHMNNIELIPLIDHPLATPTLTLKFWLTLTLKSALDLTLELTLKLPGDSW